MRSNQHDKTRVRAQQLCYICEMERGVILDEVGGWLCRACHQAVEDMRLKYILREGYTLKVRAAR